MLLLLSLFLLALPVAWGHAKLSSPIPWAYEESTEAPCGGPIYANNTRPDAQWVIGTNTSISWVIADTDGYGQVSLIFETVPSNFFSNPATLTTLSLPNITWSISDYVLTFIVPNINCTGPNNTCIVRTVESPDQWTDCTTVRVVKNGTNMLLSPNGGASLCQKAFPLQCPNAQYQLVNVPVGYTLGSLSDAVTASYALINDTYHVKTPNTPGCSTSLLAYLCGKFFQNCSSASGSTCHDTCTQAVCLCGINNTQDAQDDWDCALSSLGKSAYDLGGPCNKLYGQNGQCKPTDFSSKASLALPCFSVIFALLLTKMLL